MARTTSFTLGEELEEFVREKVDSGAFASASEVLREALRRMADEERKERALLNALDAGLASGRARPGGWSRVDAKVRARVRAKVGRAQAKR
ncbi:MAG: type II toxin-antitoxin system ParD family antitoxin [Kofleriaceae bacterium]|nr:MAG: type II toxin-antitoxin system ParD family antitoxin [Kofleriaceae bacterium]MBZ0236248.1 type II toxin-antitoxin system ParD family antitoxin [Kofleriaceae bacterium]